MTARYNTVNLPQILQGEASAHRDADALVAVPGGWDASTPDQILENLETWEKRVQNEKGFLVETRPVVPSVFVQCSGPLDRVPEEKPVPAGQTRRNGARTGVPDTRE